MRTTRREDLPPRRNHSITPARFHVWFISASVNSPCSVALSTFWNSSRHHFACSTGYSNRTISLRLRSNPSCSSGNFPEFRYPFEAMRVRDHFLQNVAHLYNSPHLFHALQSALDLQHAELSNKTPNSPSIAFPADELCATYIFSRLNHGSGWESAKIRDFR